MILILSDNFNHYVRQEKIIINRDFLFLVMEDSMIWASFLTEFNLNQNNF